MWQMHPPASLPLPCREASDGGYETVDASAAALQRPYTALAALLNCRPEEIAILTSATAAWQQVLYGLAWGWRPGDRVLTSVHEYGSNAIALLQLARWAGEDGGALLTAACRLAAGFPARHPGPALPCLPRPQYCTFRTTQCRRTGVSLEVVPETPAGDIDTAALERMLASSPKPVLVAISHVPTSSGAWTESVGTSVSCMQDSS